MTAALIVTTGGRQTGKVIIEKDAFVIGRSRRCNLVLDDKNVSREHAVIAVKAGRYEIRDRGSRNGTSLNGTQLIAQTPLNDGDTIQIGHYELRFLQNADATSQSDQDVSRTRCMPAAQPPAREKPSDARQKIAGGPVYKLTALEGPLKGEAWSNWAGDLTFGRGADNMVILQEDVVSLSHAKIRRANGLFRLEDLGSANGTFLQGTRVRSARLKNGQRIRIGTSNFAFSVVDPERKKYLMTLTAVSLVFMAIIVAVVVLLTPGDQVEPLIQQGVQLRNNGDFARAKEAFEHALAINPGNRNTVKHLQIVNGLIEREKTLQTAKTAAENEQFGEAMDICSKLLITYPNYKKAKDLELIIGKVRDAQTALDAKNWTDAASLLAKAAESYPDSAILAKRLTLAKTERAAQENLTKAKEFLAQSQPENAAELLAAIPASSVYCPEATTLLQNMKSADLLAAQKAAAQSAYRRGNVVEARAAVRKGLKLSPGNAELLALDAHIGEMEKPWKELQAARAGSNSNDIRAIFHALDMCRRVTVMEPDSQNYFRLQADQFKLQLDQALADTERNVIATADALVKDGNKREAYKFYLQAASINPGNSIVRKAMDRISDEITGECQKTFREGLVYEETGQPDLAIAAYEKVLRIAIEGDRYSERARDKLRQLKK